MLDNAHGSGQPPLSEVPRDGSDASGIGGEPVTRLRAPVRAALIVALVSPSLSMMLLPPTLPMIAQYLGGGVRGEIVAQQAQALPFLGLAVGGLLSGTLISRFGLKRSIIAGALGFSLGALVSGSAVSAGILLSGCLLIGLAASLLTCALTAATGSFFQDEARGRMLGYQTAAADFGAISAGILGAALAGSLGWRAPFVVFAAFGLVVLTLIARAELRENNSPIDERGGLRTAASKAGSSYLTGFAVFLMLGTSPTLLPFHLADHGLTLAGERAAVLTATPLFAMFAALAYALSSGRLGERWVILLATGFSVTGFAGLAVWTGGMWLAAVEAACVGVGVGLSMPLVFRSALRRTPKELHGYSVGLLNTANFSAAFLSPMLLGPIMRQFGAESLFSICASAWLVAGGLVFLARMRAARHAPTIVT